MRSHHAGPEATTPAGRLLVLIVTTSIALGASGAGAARAALADSTSMQSVLRIVGPDEYGEYTPIGSDLIRTAPLPGTVALTFDDGPHPAWTPVILDVLADLDVRATFFVLGSSVERYPEIARRIVTEGHSLQNHAFWHSNLARLTSADTESEIRRGANAIATITGGPPDCFRPPHGASNQRVASIVQAEGEELVMWDRNSLDFAHQSSSVLIEMARDWRAGDIVLMHDVVGYLYDDGTLEQMIREMRQRGIRFSTICEARAPIRVPNVS